MAHSQEAQVTPLFKKQTQNPGYNWPVSPGGFLSNVIRRASDFLLQNSLGDSNQSGFFQSGHFTEALKASVFIFSDVSAAFSTVNNHILPSALFEVLGKAHSWFESHITERSFSA